MVKDMQVEETDNFRRVVTSVPKALQVLQQMHDDGFDVLQIADNGGAYLNIFFKKSSTRKPKVKKTASTEEK